jgi:putative heme transporter
VAIVGEPVGPTEPPAPAGDRPDSGTRHRSGWRRAWPFIRVVGGLALAGFAAWAVIGRKGELAGATSYLEDMDWVWLVVAIVLEIGSIVAYGALQRQILLSGDLDVGLPSSTAITLAYNSLTNSLPGGVAWGSLFSYHQFRRRGADETLSVWAIIADNACAAVTLAALATVGLVVAGSQSSSGLGVVAPTFGVIVGIVVVVVIAWRRGLLRTLATGAVGLVKRLTGRPRATPRAVVDRTFGRLTAVTPSRRQWGIALTWAMANWVLDCGCLVAAFGVVGAPVPWRGVLLAYGAGQLAANLPITPGGLGVVEGSITIALVAYGGAEATTVAAVLVYRLLSFWASLPIGWGTAVVLEIHRRSGRGKAHAGQSDLVRV